MIGKNKVSLLIPTLNEIDGMRWYMPRLKKEWQDEILVGDDGSTDGTIEYCKENGYKVIIQSGKGLTNAQDEALKLLTGDIVIMTTPDGNSLPELNPLLAEKVAEGYDMVIASRYLGSARSEDDDIFTGFGNKLFTFMINLLFGGKYTDTLVGLRAYRRDAIDKMRLCGQEKQGWLRGNFLRMCSWEVCASIRAAKLKLKVYEIPGDEPKRIGGARKMSIIKNGFGILFEVTEEFFSGKKFLKYPIDGVSK